MDKWQQKIGAGVAPYLEPGETVLGAISASVKGRAQSLGTGGLVGQAIGGSQQGKSRAAADAAGISLPSGTIGIVVTQRRLLVLSLGVGAKVKALESSVPVSSVHSVEVKRFGLAATITLVVRDQWIRLEGRVGPGRELAAALDAAKSAPPT